MAALGTKAITPLPLISEPTENTSDATPAAPVALTPGTVTAQAVQLDEMPQEVQASKLSPEQKAKINAKYEAKHHKLNSKYQKACERLDMEPHPSERTIRKRHKIDQKAKKRGDRINDKHSRKLGKAEKKAEKKAERAASRHRKGNAKSDIPAADQV